MQTNVALLAVEIGIAEAQRGIFETAGENRGDELDQIQLAANGVVGQMWCAKFVWWCFDSAARRLRVKNPFPRIFLSSALETWAARENRVVKTPERGDVFVKNHKHTGLASGGLLSGLSVPAVEGNTWTKSPSKQGVYETKKTSFAQCTFIRL